MPAPRPLPLSSWQVSPRPASSLRPESPSPRAESRRRATAVAASLALIPCLASTLAAQTRAPGTNGAGDAGRDPITTEGYIAPPEAIAKLVTAPREANASYTSPNPGSRQYFLRTVSDGLPTLEFVGKAHYNLGGLQIDYRANRERTMTMRSGRGLETFEWSTGRKIPIAVPAGARVGSASWSPDGSQLAFLALFPDATHIYVADPATGKSRAVTTRSLLATAVTNFEWTADGKSIVTVLVPATRGAEPKEPEIATAPSVRFNDGSKLKTRTYPDLIASPYEKALLEYHTTGQLAVVDVKSRAVRSIGAPGLIRTISPSPDGQYTRVTYVTQPFSYYLPVSSFGTTDVILDGTGKTVREIGKRAIREADDPDAPAPQARAAAVDTGRRSLAWHPYGSGLLYAQLAPAPARTGPMQLPTVNAVDARDGSAAAGTPSRAQLDSARNAARRDRLVHWLPPFDSASAKTLYETDGRITAARFSDNGKILFVSETGTAGTTENAIFLDENNAKFTIIAPRRGGGGRPGAGGAPGGGGGGAFGRGAQAALVTRMGSRGVPVVVVSTDGKSVFQQGATPDSGDAMPKSYVERIDIRSGTRTRVYESAGDVLETISAPLDDDFTRVLVQRESPTVVPQTFIVETATKTAKQLTQNTDPAPEMTAAIRRTYKARRADGKTFNVRVTLPANFKEGSKLPALFWFYPREYDTQEAYDRSLQPGAGVNPARRFQSFGPRSMAFLTTQGYAVVEPDAPIFASEGQLPNDNYVNDLRNDLAATIDALDTLGIIDRQRLGIGGHSYGAFSTVNAMVHTPFFKAGIAGDGAYNRTLTPNGFQTERRDLWQGRQTYLEMSPLLYADQLNGALLMYHSVEDQNVGTDPTNSIRLFHALQGLGKTSSLYMYPYEDHGPIAKETVLDQWARWSAWMDKYVKNAGKKTEKITSF